MVFHCMRCCISHIQKNGNDVKKCMKIRCRLKINFNLSSEYYSILFYIFIAIAADVASELKWMEKWGMMHTIKMSDFIVLVNFYIETIQNETGCGWNRGNLSFSIGRKI